MIIHVDVYVRDQFVIYRTSDGRTWYHEYGSELPDRELIEVDRVSIKALETHTFEEFFDLCDGEYDIVGPGLDKIWYRFYRFMDKEVEVTCNEVR